MAKKKWIFTVFSFFKRIYLCIFTEKEMEGERLGDEHQSVACLLPPAGDSPGMCPDSESNWQPFGSQAGAQSAEPHQPGLQYFLIKEIIKIHNLNIGYRGVQTFPLCKMHFHVIAK